jgi:hypothetical protein
MRTASSALPSRSPTAAANSSPHGCAISPCGLLLHQFSCATLLLYVGAIPRLPHAAAGALSRCHLPECGSIAQSKGTLDASNAPTTPAMSASLFLVAEFKADPGRSTASHKPGGVQSRRRLGSARSVALELNLARCCGLTWHLIPLQTLGTRWICQPDRKRSDR